MVVVFLIFVGSQEWTVLGGGALLAQENGVLPSSFVVLWYHNMIPEQFSRGICQEHSNKEDYSITASHLNRNIYVLLGQSTCCNMNRYRSSLC